MLSLLLACTASTSDTADTGAFAPYEPLPECPDNGGLDYLPPTPPNVLLVVDQSGSMQPHWDSLLQLTPYVEAMGDLTRAGLALFPDGVDECSVADSIAVPMAPGTGTEIMTRISAGQPAGGTPMGEVLNHIALRGRLQDPYRENVVVLVSDGEPTCEGSAASAVEAVERMMLLDEPVKMHFVGFAGTSASNSVLETMAERAEVHVGEGNYYEASDVSELVERLSRVAASLDTCGYALQDRVDAVEVTLDGVEVPACTSSDCIDGFAYDVDAGIVTLAPLTCRTAAATECPDIRIEEAR